MCFVIGFPLTSCFNLDNPYLGSVWYNLLNRAYNSRAYSTRAYINRTFGQKVIGCLVVNKKSTFEPLNCVIFFILDIFRKVL